MRETRQKDKICRYDKTYRDMGGMKSKNQGGLIFLQHLFLELSHVQWSRQHTHAWFDEVNSLQGAYNISDAEVNLCLEVLVMIKKKRKI